jgi:hypothetical protein
MQQRLMIGGQRAARGGEAAEGNQPDQVIGALDE